LWARETPPKPADGNPSTGRTPLMTTTEPRPVYTGTTRPTTDQIDFARGCLERQTGDFYYWWSVINSLTESLAEIQRWHFEDCPRADCKICLHLSTANATTRAHGQIQDARRAADATAADLGAGSR
jgi:hypothetical protein